MLQSQPYPGRDLAHDSDSLESAAGSEARKAVASKNRLNGQQYFLMPELLDPLGLGPLSINQTNAAETRQGSQLAMWNQPALRSN